MTEQLSPWCPLCFLEAGVTDASTRNVLRILTPSGARGQTVTPWDNGGWQCGSCGLTAPEHSWAKLMAEVIHSIDVDLDIEDFQSDIDRAYWKAENSK